MNTIGTLSNYLIQYYGCINPLPRISLAEFQTVTHQILSSPDIMILVSLYEFQSARHKPCITFSTTILAILRLKLQIYVTALQRY